MEPNESTKEFSDWFLHLCYELPREDTNWDLFKQNFKCLVHISLHSEYEPRDVFIPPNLVNHETPKILEE